MKILLKSIGSDTPALIADPGDPIEARGSAWPVSFSATSWVYIEGKVVPIDKKHFFIFQKCSCSHQDGPGLRQMKTTKDRV